MRARWWTVAALLVLGACARRLVQDPPAGPGGAAGGGVSVTLLWTAPVDLDLYVTDPALETVYFANRRSRSGGFLERDARCAERQPGEHAERVRWTDPPPGRYRVGVDFPEACEAGVAEAAYRVVVDADGRRQEVTGRARREERKPRVLDFSVEGRR